MRINGCKFSQFQASRERRCLPEPAYLRENLGRWADWDGLRGYWDSDLLPAAKRFGRRRLWAEPRLRRLLLPPRVVAAVLSAWGLRGARLGSRGPGLADRWRN